VSTLLVTQLSHAAMSSQWREEGNLASPQEDQTPAPHRILVSDLPPLLCSRHLTLSFPASGRSWSLCSLRSSQEGTSLSLTFIPTARVHTLPGQLTAQSQDELERVYECDHHSSDESCCQSQTCSSTLPLPLPSCPHSPSRLLRGGGTKMKETTLSSLRDRELRRR
jgi:hypothetical protein